MKIGYWTGVLSACTTLLCSAFAYEHPVKVVLFPYQEAVLVAQVDGTINKYFYRVGQPFKAGETLLSFDDTPHQIELQRVTARREEIEVQLKLAKETYLSQKQLLNRIFRANLNFSAVRRSLKLFRHGLKVPRLIVPRRSSASVTAAAMRRLTDALSRSCAANMKLSAPDSRFSESFTTSSCWR